MTETHWTTALTDLRASADAVTWASAYDSLDAAWAACERADWMLWLLGRVAGPPESDDRKRLVLCACACARTALRFVKAGETRPLACIETAEKWARGEATIAEVLAARRNAYDAAAAAVAAYAAYDADAAAVAAADAAVAAAADADDAVADAAADDRAQSLKSMAAIVREHYPTAPVLGGVQ